MSNYRRLARSQKNFGLDRDERLRSSRRKLGPAFGESFPQRITCVFAGDKVGWRNRFKPGCVKRFFNFRRELRVACSV